MAGPESLSFGTVPVLVRFGLYGTVPYHASGNQFSPAGRSGPSHALARSGGKVRRVYAAFFFFVKEAEWILSGKRNVDKRDEEC